MNENTQANLLGAVGMAKGVYEEFIKPDTAYKAWAWIGALVTAYELTCPRGELLSEGVDRAIEKHPVAVPVAIGYTALHLCNLLPEKVDLFHQISERVKQ